MKRESTASAARAIPTNNRAAAAVKTDIPKKLDTSVRGKEGYIGVYSPESRKARLAKFMEKRKKRVWTKRVKYDVRKNFADSRMRYKGRFVKKEDEQKLREAMNMA